MTTQRGLTGRVLTHLRAHTDTDVTTDELCEALGEPPSRVVNALYALRRGDVPVQIIKSRTVWRYAPNELISRGGGHGYRGHTRALRVLEALSDGRLVCSDPDTGHTYLARRFGAPDPDEGGKR